MTWVHVPHRCPLFAATFASVIVPVGSVWRCDDCGKRYVKTRKEGLQLESEVLAKMQKDWPRPEVRAPSMVDVGARERAVALAWLDRHVDGVYADLGLQRPVGRLA